MKIKKSTRIALTAVLASFALGLGYLEFLLPVDIAGIPGVKLGLANVTVMAALYLLGFRDAAVISVFRVTLSWLLFGNVTSFLYSLAGGALSLAVMWIMKKSGKFGHIGVSVSGAVAHNVAQVAVAAALLSSAGILWYLPPLLIASAVTGTLNGLLLKAALPAAEKILSKR